MKLTRDCIAWHTDTGRRKNNEDCCGFHIAQDRSAALLVVADGMGGHAGGEVASQIALTTLLEAFQHHGFAQAEELLAEGLRETHRKILHEARQDSGKDGMGTTAVAAVLRADEIVIGHVGDSRALQFRLPYVRRLTQDHLFAIDVLGVEENQAKHHPRGNVLSQALGIDAEIRPAINRFDLQSGDVVLLCTDGISECVTEPGMSECLAEDSFAQAPQRVVQAALANGSRDNCTMMAARVP